MGVNTNAILRKGTTIESIAKAIAEKYSDVDVRASRDKDSMYVLFKDGADHRQIFVSFSDSCERDHNIAGVWVSLGCRGNSVEIATYLCDTFGGYLDENDCDDDGYHPINFDLYSQGVEFTKLDEFRHKVITKLGYNKLDSAMELFNEYIEIKKT